MLEPIALRRLSVPAIALIAVVSSGSWAAVAPPEPLPDHIEFVAGYFDANFDPIPSADLPRAVLLRIAVITGSFNGAVNGPDVAQVKTEIRGKVTLDLRALTEKLTSLAEPLRRDATEGELLITPKETRFARLATLVAYPENGKPVGGATFRRSRDEALLLVYFDRACRVLGVVHRPRGEISYDISAPRRGMYVIKLVRESQSVGRAELSSPPPILTLAITPAK
jgi:hypothetical protein